MKTNVEIANYLRFVADSYFAKYETGGHDKALQVRGFAFAKAADAVLSGQIGPDGKIAGVGESVSAVIREFIMTGQSSRMAGLQTDFALPDDLRAMADLPGLTAPFLASLAVKFSLKTRQDVLDALARIKQDNERVYLRLYSALLQEAEQATAARHAPIQGSASDMAEISMHGATTGRLPTDRENKP